ncbi:MAG: hypothetical protein VCE43_16570 [Myxococcota bacterium]
MRDAACALVVTVLVGSALLDGRDRFGGRDWDYTEADLYSARQSLLVERELPLWMPYRAGGHDALADPLSAWLSPIGILSVAFGVPVGTRVFLALAAGLGALGAMRLGRKLDLGGAGGAAIAIPLFVGVPMALYAAGGLPAFAMGLTILPWLVLCVLRRDALGMIGAGALLAVDIYAGDVNHFVYHSLFLGIFVIALALIQREPQRVVELGLVFLAAAGLAAPKLVPAGMLALENPRLISDSSYDALSATLLVNALLDRDAVRFVEAPRNEFIIATDEGRVIVAPIVKPRVRVAGPIDWVNVGSYIGILGLALGLVGAVQALRPRARHRSEWIALCVGGCVFLWLGSGHNAPLNLYDLLRELPVFSSTRRPARLIVYPLFVLVCFGGCGLAWLCSLSTARFGARFTSAAAALILVAFVLDVHGPARRAYRQSFIEPDRYQVTEGPGFRQVRGRRPPDSSYYGVPVAPFARAGVGVVNGYRTKQFEAHALAPQHADYTGEVSALGGAQVMELAVTARRIEVGLETERDDTLIVNQNWMPGWHVVKPEAATCAEHTDGRIAVRVPAGTERVILYYTTPGLYAGIAITFAGAVATAGTLMYRRRR